MGAAYGVRCLGPANPSHHERLKRYAALARKRGREQQQKADDEVLLMPVRYALAGSVPLFRHEADEAAGNVRERGGWVVRPHWRRGHWRWQACGAGRQVRRQVWRQVAIAAVLVNGHRLAGAGVART